MTVLDKLVTQLGFETDLSALRRFDGAVKNTRRRLDSLSTQMFGVGRAVGIVGGAATGVFGLAAKQAINWESDFTGVRKTVDATEAEFEVLESTLRRMARDDVPLPVGELAALAESAGQLGIETDSIDEFVKVIAQLGTTTNLAAEEGATQLARFANITGMSQDDFDRLGSTVVDLGNNFATTEAEIVGMSLRLAGAGDLIGLTEAQILGISTALTSVGINAEAGGTAFSRVFAEMDKSIQTGGDTLEAFGALTGRTGGEFAGIFKEQGADVAILEFVAGLQRTIDSGENVHLVLEELGFDTVRIRDALLRSAGAGDLLTNAIQAGSTAWDENTALAKEASLRYSTMASRFQFAKNRANDLAITVGGILAPIITDMVDRLEPLIEWVTDWVEKHPGAVKWLAGLALALVAIGGALLVIGAALKGASILLGLVQGIVAVAGVIAGIGLGPLLLIVAALVGGALLIIKHWDQIKLFFAGFWEGFTNKTDDVTAAFGRLLAEAGELVDAFSLLTEASDGSTDSGVKFGEAFGFALYTLLDAVAAILNGFGDLIRLLAWVNESVMTFSDNVNAYLLAAFQNVRDAIVGFFDLDLSEQGRAMLQSFIDGFLAVKDKLTDAVGDALSSARDFLPFSDAKKGPLSDLTASGQAIVDTLAAGIRQAGSQPVNQALQVELAGVPAIDVTAPTLPSLTAPPLPSLSLPNLDDLSAMLGGFLDRLPDLTTMTALPVGPVPPPAAAGAGVGGGMTLTLSIGQLNVTATNADPQEIARAIAGDELARQIRALVEQVDSRVRV